MKKLVVASRNTAATLRGQPEFFQYNSIGGSQSLRGFQRDRFRGNSALVSSNELQLLFDARTHLFNGKMGLIGLYDIGRVWMNGEESKTWHDAYGGGFLIAPFNKIMASLTYAVSQEGGQFHVRFSKKLE
jgi:hemolysin activation/secretion protein